jgi:hypothetical protein
MRYDSTILSASLVAAAALAGCVQSDLPPGSLIDRDRVLGARVEVEGDPGRAAPMPGETAVVRWIVAGPAAPIEQPWTFAVCAGDGDGCTSEAFLVEGGLDAEPTLAIAVPAADALGDSRFLWILGEIGESKLIATVRLARDGVELANRNPALAADAATIADAPWPAPAPDAECAALPAIRAADGDVELALAIDPAEREAYREVLADGTIEDRLEILQVSHFTTAGSLDRQFSVIEGDDDAPATIRVGWTPPDGEEEAIPADGRIVRFVFVVRDGRGGLDLARRAACLVP